MSSLHKCNIIHSEYCVGSQLYTPVQYTTPSYTGHISTWQRDLIFLDQKCRYTNYTHCKQYHSMNFKQKYVSVILAIISTLLYLQLLLCIFNTVK